MRVLLLLVTFVAFPLFGQDIRPCMHRGVVDGALDQVNYGDLSSSKECKIGYLRSFALSYSITMAPNQREAYLAGFFFEIERLFNTDETQESHPQYAQDQVDFLQGRQDARIHAQNVAIDIFAAETRNGIARISDRVVRLAENYLMGAVLFSVTSRRPHQARQAIETYERFLERED